MVSVKVKDLKKGEKIIEQDLGMSIRATVLEDARRVVEDSKNGWAALARTDAGAEFELFQDHEVTWYGPYLYREDAK